MSLYLKYRPRGFDSLVGQDFIKQSLENALSQEKLVGAYLFTGPRGTGKTSSARILALGMNCLGEGVKPCFECEICKNFQEGRLTDIIEIDAASNTGVDNIREIIERAQFMPNQTRYKVYIVDEVHMLSKGAFNALLKILEEPPKHVKFILATTEIHKVPETILSRCQRYDFKSIGSEDIKNRLLFIAGEEKIQVEEKALDYVVKNAQGGLRNAINLFEQLTIDSTLSYTYIVENLGITAEDTLKGIVEKLVNSDRSVIADFESFIASGKNIRLLFRDLVYLLKDTIIQSIQRQKSIKKELTIIEILNDTYSKSKQSFDEQITLFTGILKIVSIGEEIIQAQEIKPSQLKEEKIPEIKLPVQKQEIVGETPLSHDDIEDLFSQEVKKKDVPVKLNTKSEGVFDKEVLLNTLKNSGIKGSILTSLRGATISIQENKIIIQSASKFALQALDPEKNFGIYKTAFESLGFNQQSLEIL